jgi:hypothetical protein
MVKGVAEEVANGSEPGDVRLRANGGLSDDDTLEQEAAMSSPLKGTDSRGSAKVSSPNFQLRNLFLPPVYLGDDKGQEGEREGQAQNRPN